MPRNTKRSRPWSVAAAQAALKELAASGLSVRAFARREGVDDDRIYRWRRRFAAEREPRGVATPTVSPALIELRPSPRRSEPVEVVLASGVMLRVSETIDPAALTRLVAALR